MVATRKLCCLEGWAGVIFRRFRICEVHMRAFTGLPAVLLMLSCTAFAQTAPVQPTAPTEQAAPVQPTVAETSKPEVAASQPSTPSPAAAAATPAPTPIAATTATDAAAATAEDVPAVAAVPADPIAPQFGPGVKVFIAPMNGFELRVADAIVKKKVPVVLVSERGQADFVVSGIAHVHKRNFFTGFVLTTNGYGSVWVEDAHTGKQVFLYKFTRVDANTTVDQDYQNWADSAAKRMKKTLEPKKK